MKAKSNIFYIFPVFLLVSACIWGTSSSKIESTPVSFPSDPPAIEPAAMGEQTASPTVVAGSFADFYLFGTEIAAALQARNISFFNEYATASTWICLGDETIGVCKDMSPETTVTGIPVTYDWATYEVYSKENYNESWQTRFASSSVLKLAAIANQFGDNPLMPMAGQSFLAIVGVADDNNPSSIHEVRVLFFEYYEHTWHLAGEFVTVEHVGSWLNDTCSACYDMWAAWPE